MKIRKKPSSGVNAVMGENIKAYMKLLGLTQTELAKRLNVSQAAVSSWCGGLKTPRGETLDRICEELQISRGNLLRDRKGKIIISRLPEAENIYKEHPILKDLFEAIDGLSDETIELLIRIVNAVKEAS